MGWKDEVKNSPIQTTAAVLALVGTLVSAGFYLANRSDVTESEGDTSSSTVLQVELPPKPGPPPFLDGKLPPPPFEDSDSSPTESNDSK